LWHLEPDAVTIGKAIAGGIPCGAYGLSAELADRALNRTDLDLVDMGGVGGTLAGNPVSLAAARACLGEVLTPSAFDRMIAHTTRLAEALRSAIARYALPWSVSQLGARVEYRFADPAPRNGTESNAAHDQDLDDYLHVFAANRGVLLTPFHNMALTCPATTEADVDRYAGVFQDALAQLCGSGSP
jgi:glutamate-1-semialdehyde 2,1-aminomutase